MISSNVMNVSNEAQTRAGGRKYLFCTRVKNQVVSANSKLSPQLITKTDKETDQTVHHNMALEINAVPKPDN